MQPSCILPIGSFPGLGGFPFFLLFSLTVYFLAASLPLFLPTRLSSCKFPFYQISLFDVLPNKLSSEVELIKIN